jgi:hypothetical protein
MRQSSLRTLSVGLSLLFCCLFVIKCPDATAATTGPAFSTGEPKSRFDENTFFEDCERSSPTIVCTRQGRIQGTTENGLLAFRNIPFAASPVGDLRWRPPAPPAAWEGIRDGSTFGNICLQDDFAGGFMGSEDCLTLNVLHQEPYTGR